ncbi:MAG TPA: hypothetical protein VKA96_02535 [Solirubrobacteraceae bacterium]|jgi:hypothetical protein|nr:hypothetical protein [Solirubrobacteraceae bacterium]
MPFVRLRETVAMRATSGEPLDAIEDEVIEPSGLPEEQKAALWLYGWASQQRSGQAASARAVRPASARWPASGAPRALG